MRIYEKRALPPSAEAELVKPWLTMQEIAKELEEAAAAEMPPKKLHREITLQAQRLRGQAVMAER